MKRCISAVLTNSVSGSVSPSLASVSTNSLNIAFPFPFLFPRPEPSTDVRADASLMIGFSLLASAMRPSLRGRPRKVGWGGRWLCSSCKGHFLCELPQ